MGHPQGVYGNRELRTDNCFTKGDAIPARLFLPRAAERSAARFTFGRMNPAPPLWGWISLCTVSQDFRPGLLLRRTFGPGIGSGGGPSVLVLPAEEDSSPLILLRRRNLRSWPCCKKEELRVVAWCGRSSASPGKAQGALRLGAEDCGLGAEEVVVSKNEANANSAGGAAQWEPRTAVLGRR